MSKDWIRPFDITPGERGEYIQRFWKDGVHNFSPSNYQDCWDMAHNGDPVAIAIMEWFVDQRALHRLRGTLPGLGFGTTTGRTTSNWPAFQELPR